MSATRRLPALAASILGLAAAGGAQETPRRLTRDGLRKEELAWAPDGRRLACALYHRPGRIGIAVAEPPGAWTILTTDPVERAPAWSPDGKRLAFIHVTQSGTDGELDLHEMAPDGSGRRVLFAAPKSFENHPSWSPDGKRLLFTTTRDKTQEIYTAGADGGDPRRLTQDPSLKQYPSWSPDGRRIAYVVRVGRAEQEIHMVAPGGGTPLRLTTGYAPSWSPDGRRVAFVVARVGDPQIYTADPDGGHTRRLIPSGLNFQPIWSPDGRFLAFLASRDGDLALWVMSTEGREQRRLAPAAGDLSQLPVFSWRPPLRAP